MTPAHASTPQPASDGARSRASSKRFEIGAPDDESPLATLIDRSSATAAFGACELEKLVEYARMRKRRVSITGMLVYDLGALRWR